MHSPSVAGRMQAPEGLGVGADHTLDRRLRRESPPHAPMIRELLSSSCSARGDGPEPGARPGRPDLPHGDRPSPRDRPRARSTVAPCSASPRPRPVSRLTPSRAHAARPGSENCPRCAHATRRSYQPLLLQGLRVRVKKFTRKTEDGDAFRRFEEGEFRTLHRAPPSLR